MPNASKFLLLSVLTLIQTICPKITAKQLPQIAKLLLPVDVRRSKTSLHKYPVRPIETTRRGFQTIFQYPNRYNSKLTNYSFFQMHPANLSLQFQSLEQQSRLQSSGGKTGLDTHETKSPTYWNTPFNKICLGMKIGQQFKSVVINHPARSLYSLIADNKYRATSLGRNT